jgi:hypothetical protein
MRKFCLLFVSIVLLSAGCSKPDELEKLPELIGEWKWFQATYQWIDFGGEDLPTYYSTVGSVQGTDDEYSFQINESGRIRLYINDERIETICIDEMTADSQTKSFSFSTNDENLYRWGGNVNGDTLIISRNLWPFIMMSPPDGSDFKNHFVRVK